MPDPIVAVRPGITPTSPIPNRSGLSSQYHDRIEQTARDLRVQKIASIILFSLLGALIVTGVVLLALTPAIPIAALLAVGVVALVVLVAAGIFGAKYQKTAAQQKACFEQVLKEDSGRFSPEKAAFFEKYGKHCEELSFLEIPCSLSRSQYGVTKLGNYFTWQVSDQCQIKLLESTKKFLKNELKWNVGAERLQSGEKIFELQRLIEELDTYLASESQPLPPEELKEKSRLESQIKQLFDEITRGKVIMPASRSSGISQEEFNQEQCWTGEAIANVIRNCPNLKKLYLGSLMHYPAVREACKGRKFENPDRAIRNAWDRDFPNMAVN